MSLTSLPRLSRRILEHRYLPLMLFVAAFAISAPALKMGWEPCDDLRHRVKLIAQSQLPERLLETGLVPENSGKLTTVMRDLHTLARTAEDMEKLKGYGTVPWWANDTLRFSNWRPLDGLTHWLDYRFFPDSAAMIHLHSITWFAAVIFLVALLYRRFIGANWVAGFASLLYLVDDNNFVPVMWIANRNLLISLVFGIIALLAHEKWRKGNSLLAVLVALFCFCLSLLATEAGLATFAYLFAYAFTLDRAKPLRAGLSLAPYLSVIVVWRIVYNALGHGAAGCALIVDPTRNPLRFAQLAPERICKMLAGQWSFIPPEVYMGVSDPLKAVMMLISIGSLAIIFFVLLPLICKDRTARFWFIGMMLSVLPFCASAPMGRFLLFPAIGGFALTAQLMASLRTQKGWLRRPRLRAIVVWGTCVVLQLVHLPGAVASRIVTPKVAPLLHQQITRTCDFGIEPGLENQDVILVNAANSFMHVFTPSFRAHYDQSLPRSIRALTPGLCRLEVVRTGERTLAVHVKSGNIFTCQHGPKAHLVYAYDVAGDLFLPDASLLYPGKRVVLPRFSAQVVSVDEKGMPTKVLFEFDVSLEDPSLKWLQWDWWGNSYKSFKPPSVGERTVLNGPFY